MLDRNLIPIIHKKRRLHYYGEKLHACNNAFDMIPLNPLQEEFVLLSNGKRTVSEIYLCILEKYNIIDTDKNWELFSNLLAKLYDSKIIDFSNNIQEDRLFVSGEKGMLFPNWMLIEITSKCNFGCPHCYKEAGKNGKNLEFNLYTKIVEKMKTKTSNLVITGGEPLLHPEIKEILLLAGKSYKTHLLTNGYLLQNIPIEILYKLESIQISLYGYDEDMCSAFTGMRNSFEKVCASIEYSTPGLS